MNDELKDPPIHWRVLHLAYWVGVLQQAYEDKNDAKVKDAFEQVSIILLEWV